MVCLCLAADIVCRKGKKDEEKSADHIYESSGSGTDEDTADAVFFTGTVRKASHLLS